MTDTNNVKKIHLLARLFLAVAAVSLTVSAGRAHHGWSWAVDEQSTLEGTIKDVSMAPPHPSLHVTDAGGIVWFVELSNPSQTARAGFTATSAKPGDIVLAVVDGEMTVKVLRMNSEQRYFLEAANSAYKPIRPTTSLEVLGVVVSVVRRVRR